MSPLGVRALGLSIHVANLAIWKLSRSRAAVFLGQEPKPGSNLQQHGGIENKHCFECILWGSFNKHARRNSLVPRMVVKSSSLASASFSDDDWHAACHFPLTAQQPADAGDRIRDVVVRARRVVDRVAVASTRRSRSFPLGGRGNLKTIKLP